VPCWEVPWWEVPWWEVTVWSSWFGVSNPDQDAIIVERSLHDSDVTGILCPRTGVYHVVAGVDQPMRQLLASATVAEQAHGSADLNNVERVVGDHRVRVDEARLDVLTL